MVLETDIFPPRRHRSSGDCSDRPRRGPAGTEPGADSASHWPGIVTEWGEVSQWGRGWWGRSVWTGRWLFFFFFFDLVFFCRFRKGMDTAGIRVRDYGRRPAVQSRGYSMGYYPDETDRGIAGQKSGAIVWEARRQNAQVRSTGLAGLDGLEAILGPCFGRAVGSICPASSHHL